RRRPSRPPARPGSGGWRHRPGPRPRAGRARRPAAPPSWFPRRRCRARSASGEVYRQCFVTEVLLTPRAPRRPDREARRPPRSLALVGAVDDDVLEVAIFLVVVKAVPDDEVVLDREADVVDPH